MRFDWLRLFPPAGHRFRMDLRRGDAKSFWRRSDMSGQIGAERHHWLSVTPSLYTSLLPEGAEIAREALRAMAAWSGDGDVEPQSGEPPALALPRCGACLEPDWVILADKAGGEPLVLGGVVIFPSGWSLPEKLSQPLSSVHEPAPGLQKGLGAPIGSFFKRLAPGDVWERENWGVSADAELNHHPTRKLKRLTKNAIIAQAWLRLERQFLTRLPQTGGILFGIRVSHHRLDELATVPGVASRLAAALATMEPEVAEYKGLAEARNTLIRQLRQMTAFVANAAGPAAMPPP